MENLYFAFNAIAPILIQVYLGYALARIGFLKEDFLKNANSFVFKVALPCLLFVNVYSIGSLTEINFSFVLYCIGFVSLLFAAGLVFVKFAIPKDSQKGVILQCVFRSNFAIIGIPLAESLGSAAAKGAAAVLSAFTIPLYNILSVFALSIWSGESGNGKKKVRSIIHSIVTNPLIIGVALGVVALIIRSFEFGFTLKGNLPFLYTSIESVSRMATPLALIVLGGRFDLKTTRGSLREIIIGVLSRTVISPALAIFLAVILSKYTDFFTFTATEYPSIIALFGTPVAVASAVMADEMKNDGRLAAQLVVWTSIVSIVTIYITIVIMRTLGLL